MNIQKQKVESEPFLFNDAGMSYIHGLSIQKKRTLSSVSIVDNLERLVSFLQISKLNIF